MTQSRDNSLQKWHLRFWDFKNLSEFSKLFEIFLEICQLFLDFLRSLGLEFSRVCKAFEILQGF